MKKINPTKNKEWWHIKTPSTKDLSVLTSVYNEKYGKKHNGLDLRLHDNTFPTEFTSILNQFKNTKKILVVGANDGYEITFIKKVLPHAKITALDVSTIALEKLKNAFKEVEVVHQDMENTNFKDKEFDLYISCRSINSTNVNVDRATEEALRISKNIVVSVSNGYLIDGKIQKGLFDYETMEFDLDSPLRMKNSIIKKIQDQPFDISEYECSSEIFIVVKSTKTL